MCFLSFFCFLPLGMPTLVSMVVVLVPRAVDVPTQVRTALAWMFSCVMFQAFVSICAMGIRCFDIKVLHSAFSLFILYYSFAKKSRLTCTSKSAVAARAAPTSPV